MKPSAQILSPAMLLKKLSSLSLSGGGLSATETLKWLRRFDTADKRRARFQKETGVPAPQAVIFSPTMRCNYNCTGCYSRNHPQDHELSSERIDTFFGELEEAGTSVCLISGGEPFIHRDLPDLMQKHPDLLFIVFTNGSQITESLARQLRTSRNVVPTLSIDGSESTITQRRGKTAVPNIQRAIEHFKAANLLFGFSTMVTRDTLPEIMNEAFFSDRVRQGYQLGFVLEYVPVGKDINRDQILDHALRKELRETVIRVRKKQPLLLFQLPDDTHDSVSCGAADRFMHINSNGGLEPCPFAHHSDSSLSNQTFREALRSPLFKQIRETPAVFVKKELSCALAENEDRLKEMA
jgi:MoaA/NifB/PqqE/SkfB family radical SAM enzyme